MAAASGRLREVREKFEVRLRRAPLGNRRRTSGRAGEAVLRSSRPNADWARVGVEFNNSVKSSETPLPQVAQRPGGMPPRSSPHPTAQTGTKSPLLLAGSPLDSRSTARLSRRNRQALTDRIAPPCHGCHCCHCRGRKYMKMRQQNAHQAAGGRGGKMVRLMVLETGNPQTGLESWEPGTVGRLGSDSGVSSGLHAWGFPFHSQNSGSLRNAQARQGRFVPGG
ncbi:hypothetical protein B0I37DRAFT_206366 [Chaetomium sp. MPI-CAGE-AT-0009]|nr:hypothetical protein B0I37DRAFT_206366 [Chaetomium sp. MPI-CAGE-AT-0009]